MMRGRATQAACGANLKQTQCMTQMAEPAPPHNSNPRANATPQSSTPPPPTTPATDSSVAHCPAATISSAHRRTAKNVGHRRHARRCGRANWGWGFAGLLNPYAAREGCANIRRSDCRGWFRWSSVAHVLPALLMTFVACSVSKTERQQTLVLTHCLRHLWAGRRAKWRSAIRSWQ